MSVHVHEQNTSLGIYEDLEVLTLVSTTKNHNQIEKFVSSCKLVLHVHTAMDRWVKTKNNIFMKSSNSLN